jgi:hypothetical protein
MPRGGQHFHNPAFVFKACVIGADGDFHSLILPAGPRERETKSPWTKVDSLKIIR